MQLVVVMPVYNERECIAAVVTEWLTLVRRIGNSALLVVDDGSTDGTAEELAKLAAEDLAVLRQPNSGHGAAIAAGYRIALDSGAEWIFQTDSDGQIPASQFQLLWQRRDESPFILGWRRTRRDGILRNALSHLNQELIGFLFGTSIKDPNVPFRLLLGTALSWYMRRLPVGVFAPNVFLSVMAAREKALLSVALTMHRARATGTPSIKGWKTLKVAWRCFNEFLAFRRTLK